MGNGSTLFSVSPRTITKAWVGFCTALGRADLATDPAYATFEKRREHSELLIKELDRSIGALTMEELTPILDSHARHWAPVQTITEAINDPQAGANEVFATLEHPAHGPYKTLKMPVKFGQSQVRPRGPAPEPGQHTEEVLLEVGYDWDDIGSLKDTGAIL